MKLSRVMEVLTTIAKIASFISLVMTVVIKTRVLLGVESKKSEPKVAETKKHEDPQPEGEL